MNGAIFIESVRFSVKRETAIIVCISKMCLARCDEIKAVQCGKHQQQSWQMVEYSEVRFRGCASFQGFWDWSILVSQLVYLPNVKLTDKTGKPEIIPPVPWCKKNKHSRTMLTNHRQCCTECVVATRGLWRSLPNAGLLCGCHIACENTPI